MWGHCCFFLINITVNSMFFLGSLCDKKINLKQKYLSDNVRWYFTPITVRCSYLNHIRQPAFYSKRHFNYKTNPRTHLVQLLASQRLGGDQQALVVARHSGCCQVLVRQLDVLAVVFQERHDSRQQCTWLSFNLEAARGECEFLPEDDAVTLTLSFLNLLPLWQGCCPPLLHCSFLKRATEPWRFPCLPSATSWQWTLLLSARTDPKQHTHSAKGKKRNRCWKEVFGQVIL